MHSIINCILAVGGISATNTVGDVAKDLGAGDITAIISALVIAFTTIWGIIHHNSNKK